MTKNLQETFTGNLNRLSTKYLNKENIWDKRVAHRAINCMASLLKISASLSLVNTISCNCL